MSHGIANFRDSSQGMGRANAKAAEQKSRYYSLLYQEITDRKKAEETLRKHNSLLNALSDAQLRYVSGVDIAAVFKDLLNSLLAVTQSEFGIMGEVLYSEDKGAQIQVHAVSSLLGPNTPTPNILNLYLDEVITGGKPLIVNELQFESAVNNHSGDRPEWTAFLGLPLLIGASVVGVIGLINRSAVYDGDSILFLQPVLSTYTQLILTNRNEQRRKEVEAALVEERALLARRIDERTAELRAANAELAYAARAKDEFLATINHELRTPLSAILLMAETLQEEINGPLNERQKRSVSGILESGRHLLTLITDILDVAKIEAGKLRIEIAPCSVESACQASLRLMTEMAQKKDLHVSMVINPDVQIIDVDGQRLKQMLVNLLGNAIKFTSSGGAVGLEVLGDYEQNIVHFTVWDTGIGIAKEDLPKLFQPFVQIDSGHSRHFGGTGLGLVLVYRMARMHGGSVSVESKPGQGSRFTISLPWRQRLDEAAYQIEHRLPANGVESYYPAVTSGHEHGTGNGNRAVPHPMM